MNNTPSDEPHIKRDEQAKGGRYFVQLAGAEAELTYTKIDPHTISVDHTSVPDAMRGRSVGQALVRRAVEDARAEGKKIIPVCPFAKAQIDKHAEWHDVLAR